MQNEITKFQFEGNHNLTVLRYHGKPAFLAKEVGQALGYSGEGGRLAKNIAEKWAAEFVEGIDFVKIEGEELRDIKALLEAGPGSGLAFASHLVLLTESGFHLACLLTRQPVGVRLRRWLADEVLPKLVRGEPVASAADLHALTAAVTQIASAIPVIANAIESLAQRVTDLEARGPMGGTITRSQHQRLQGDVKALATLETEAGFRPSVRSATASIYNDLRSATGWGGPGQPFDRLPAHLYAHQAMKALAKRRADVERVLIGKAKARQLSLLPEPAHAALPFVRGGGPKKPN